MFDSLVNKQVLVIYFGQHSFVTTRTQIRWWWVAQSSDEATVDYTFFSSSYKKVRLKNQQK